MIIYEYPFNERIRTLLRLEDLHERYSFFLHQGHALQHHVALTTVFEMLEVASRSDLKSDLLQELERQYGGAAVVLTLGGQGSVYAKGGKRVRQPIYRVPVVDTTAAGDTFTGYFLSALASGMTPEASLDRAAKAAAIAVSRSGATDSIPSLKEVLEFQEEEC